ncbi:Nif3-like dinuclear metal center hexameric protein [Nanoarchaeota archaeon]
MVKLNTIVRFLNKELNNKAFPDDYSRNGLQVRAKKENIKKIGLAVDANIDSIKLAKKNNCDLLIVHHGILWKGNKYFNNRHERIKLLKKLNISLYANHLPLDSHPILGNNAQIANLLEVKNKKPFLRYMRTSIGYRGNLNIKFDILLKKIKKVTNSDILVDNYGPNNVKIVGIASGGCASDVDQCLKFGVDTFITGEPSHSYASINKELKMNVIYLGHYASETFGVKAVGNLIEEKYELKTKFLDVPTGL